MDTKSAVVYVVRECAGSWDAFFSEVSIVFALTLGWATPLVGSRLEQLLSVRHGRREERAVDQRPAGDHQASQWTGGQPQWVRRPRSTCRGLLFS